MLDKSIAYKNMIMRAEGLHPNFAGPVPKGYLLKPYAPGDEVQWALIETEVGEFDTEKEAKEYFVHTYLPYPAETAKRCFFAVAPSGEYAGTCTAWFIAGEESNSGVIHWFGVRPKYQGLGLGKALLFKCMQVFEEFNAFPAYLHTQTWSHKAIGMYVNAGFNILKADTFEKNPNDFEEAVEVLKNAVSKERLAFWVKSAI